MTAIREIQRVPFYVYKKQKNTINCFIQTAGHFTKKQDNFRDVFIYIQQDTLHYAIFHEIFEFGIYIQKV